jgi:hypothetical protein
MSHFYTRNKKRSNSNNEVDNKCGNGKQIRESGGIKNVIARNFRSDVKKYQTKTVIH